MRQEPPDPRQTPETWQAWTKLSIPPKHHSFIQTALWKKLPVGTRLANWLPQHTHCLVDGKPEDMRHALLECRFLPPAKSEVAHKWPYHEVFHNSLQPLKAGIIASTSSEFLGIVAVLSQVFTPRCML